MKIEGHPNVGILYESFRAQFPYFAGVVDKQYSSFGEHWLDLFENELNAFFTKDEKRIQQAVRGYGKFALDSMKLQVKFQKTKEYENKSYQEAASEVYQNKDYMFGLYLPGILLSHYLWRHHFLQHVFFIKKFLPLVKTIPNGNFYDIGVGTGFYSKEVLSNTKLSGSGFDLSPHSLEHTLLLLKAHSLSDRYSANIRDIIKNPVTPPADCLLNIEVLEHLENPQIFLNALSRMLKPGGYGLISAAINAPNADHIYLYRRSEDVSIQLKQAGFEILDSSVDSAYEPRNQGDLVPINAVFIVTKK